jgi:hypothetical protein
MSGWRKALGVGLLLLTLGVGVEVRAEVRPFVSGSLEQIQSERAGKPFILALWSASCTH